VTAQVGADTRTGTPPGVPLLASKLAVPVLPEGLVVRPRLVESLETGVRGPLTVLAASPGSGKTALLNSWVRAGGSADPVSWLTLEPEDEGDRFWSYLHVALDVSADTADDPWMPVPGTVPAKVYLAQLANALARRPQPVVAILDDFHQVRDATVPDGLEFLLRHTAGRLRLVIATRVEPDLPLHRWRLSGELIEIDDRELAFTVDETADLLARHGVELPDTHLGALHAHTEGWPAGLRLAALAMREHPDPPRFVDMFTGDQQVIAEYLSGEILADQPQETLDALLCTAQLERVCGGLVNALTGRTDGDRILADLARQNAFTIALPGEYPWYRYHRLFAEFLRAEAKRRLPDRLPELHRAAASWHAEHGRPSDALRHALAARDWGYATTLLVERWPDFVLCARAPTALALPAQAQPPPDDVVRADPELALACAADQLNRAGTDTASGYLRLADGRQHLLAEDERDRFARISTAFHLVEAQLGGDTAGCLAFAEQLLAQVPAEAADAAPARAIARTAQGSILFSAGELAAAADAFGDGLTVAEQAGLACTQLESTGKLALLHAVRGELRRAEKTARAALALPPCTGRCRLVSSGNAYLSLALVHYHRDRLDEAERYLELAAASGDPQVDPTLPAGLALTRVGVLHTRGELAAGYEILVSARDDLGPRLSPYLRDYLTVAEADLRTSYGDTDTARDLLTPLLADRRPARDLVAVALARAYLRDDDPGAAARVLPAWAEDRRDGPPMPLPLRLEAGLLAAIAVRLTGDDHRASLVLERVLELGESEGYRRLLTHGGRSVRELLVDQLDSGTAYWSTVSETIEATAPSPGTGDGLPPTELAEPLSDRELTVLRYLQGALSNLEIASDLCVSVNTVKTHVRSIYRKLHAAHRREAVLKARQLRLL
jgi:LuxR family transcriptional regulator, maltose regulon positive regulatory protein